MKIASLRTIRNRLREEGFYWKVGFCGLALAAITHAFFLVLFLGLDIKPLFFANILSVAVYLYAIFVLGIPAIETHNDGLIGWLVYGELLGHNFLATWLLGRDTGFYYYIFVPAILPFFVLSYSRLVYFLRIFGVIVISLWIMNSSLFDSSRIELPSLWIHLMYSMNLLFFLSLLAILSYLYVIHEHDERTKLHRNINLDYLTGLYNRHILSEFSTQWGEGTDPKDQGVLLIDLDRLKYLNDQYGHMCGDQALRHLSEVIREVIPDDGIAIRWGGDEFLILLPSLSDPKGLQVLSEQIQNKLQKRPLLCEGRSLNLTATYGGVIRKGDESLSSAFRRADEAIYIGKKISGRNSVVIR